MVQGRAKRKGRNLGHKRGIAQERAGLRKETKPKTKARSTRVSRAGGAKGPTRKRAPKPSYQGGRARKPDTGRGRLRGTA